MAYQRQSPDYTHHVAVAAARYPAEWDRADKNKHGGQRTDEFIRLLARDLHAIDPRVGLNGKRGGDEISLDALSYINPTAPGGGVEVIDVIVGSTHQPAWQDVTFADGSVAGKYIAPDGEVTPGPGPSPGGGFVSVPSWAAFEALQSSFEALQAEVEVLKTSVAALQNHPAAAFPARIALRTAHGKYVVAEPDQSIKANRDAAGSWETFDVEAK